MKGLLLLVFIFLFLRLTNAQILNNNSGFEDGTFLNDWAISENNSLDATFNIVTNPVREGNYALHIQHSVPDEFNFTIQ